MRVLTVLTMLGAGMALGAAPAAADSWSSAQQIATGGFVGQLVESNTGDALALIGTGTAAERSSTAAPWGEQAAFPPFAGASSRNVAMLPSGRLVAAWTTRGSCEVDVAERSRAGVWGPTTTFAQACATDGAIAYSPLVAAAGSGGILVAWGSSGGPVPRAFFAQRTNDGVWLDPFSFEGILAAAAVLDKRGNALVELATDASPQTTELLYVSGGRPVSIELLPEGSQIGELVGNTKGKVVLAINRFVDRQPAFVDVYAGTTKKLKLAATFGGPGTGAVVTMQGAAVDEGGDAVVAWSQKGSIHNSVAVMVSRRVGVKGAFGAPITVDRPHTGQEINATVYLDGRGAATVAWFQAIFKTSKGTLQVASAPAGASFGTTTALAATTLPDTMAALLAGDAAGNVTAVWSDHHGGDPSSSEFDTFTSQRAPVTE